MCMPIKVRQPSRVLAEGVHAGHEWMVIHNDIGYRCGYVKVDPGHPWHGKDSDDICCDVHGGITYAEADTPCDKDGPDNGWWLGFDCAHAGDAPDPSLPGCRTMDLDHGGYDRIRTTEYVEAECLSLCLQAAAVAPVPVPELAVYLQPPTDLEFPQTRPIQ